MYVEMKSIEELVKLVEEKGYTSYEAGLIQQEMEQSKKKYDTLIRNHGITKKNFCDAAVVVTEYYLHYLNNLRQSIPYDAMGGQYLMPMLVLQEFNTDDIAEKIYGFGEVNLSSTRQELVQEIQQFRNVQLEPKAIILYMNILEKQTYQKASRNCEQCGGKQQRQVVGW